ncbi:DsbA family oxidoreductase [Corynebacterium vitaeruminis]|uniref:DsbA family oxidoreductase n=1 Tax=Corynebacterium vitaeruminis TaxID=38305 RepID=UPI0023F66010|nr:DsbA family oxidoreductase [Corynebacterium vitaeruminis]
MRIDLWSDVVCPFCLIGKRHLELALEKFPHREDVEVVWHSFELDPTAPARIPGTLVEMISAKYGTSPEQSRRSQEDIARRAHEVGLEFNWEQAKPGNTFNAHRLIHLAAGRGLADEAAKAFITAYFTDGVAIGENAALREVAIKAGLPADEVDRVLASEEFADAVRGDEQQARALGINAVPFFLFENKWAVSGAQPVEVFVQALNTVWEETHKAPGFVTLDASDAPACGPEGC